MLKIHHAKLTESRVALIQLFIHGSCSNGHEKILSSYQKKNQIMIQEKRNCPIVLYLIQV